jgi:hypothetical protein
MTMTAFPENDDDQQPRTKEAASMSDSEERSVASAGSQPVAWAVEFDGEVEPFCGSFDKSEAIKVAGEVGRVFPLWRSPSLTEAEQLAIAWAAREADEWDEEDTPEVAAHAEALRGLARRLF